MSAAATPNLTPELLDLFEHEKVIEQGLATFLDVGWALLAIRDGKKYRAAGFGTFEAYCSERWGMTKRHAGRLMGAAETVAAVEKGDQLVPNPRPEVESPRPSSEGQVRPLAPLRDEPELAAQAWRDAVEDAEAEGRDQPTARHVEAAVERIRKPKPVTKPDLGDGISHPARFGDRLLAIFAGLLREHPDVHTVLDPFAGTGRIHELDQWDTTGVELEPEWAAMHPRTVCGSALNLGGLFLEPFDAIVTSPTYGNRLADHHDPADGSLRRSYKFDLGRDLTDGNSGAMQWGPEYRSFHEEAWAEAWRVLRPGGLFVLNVKDHIRGGRRQHVAGWHVTTLCRLGFTLLSHLEVDTGSLRQGDNAEARLPEQVYVLERDQ